MRPRRDRRPPPHGAVGRRRADPRDPRTNRATLFTLSSDLGRYLRWRIEIPSNTPALELTAVCPHDGRLSWTLAPRLDAAAMSAFLAVTRKRFPRDYCAIFLDGAGWHIAHTLRIPAHMRLVFLPPYSPELNPVEPIWNHLREKYFAIRLFKVFARSSSVFRAPSAISRQLPLR